MYVHRVWSGLQCKIILLKLTYIKLQLSESELAQSLILNTIPEPTYVEVRWSNLGNHNLPT